MLHDSHLTDLAVFDRYDWTKPETAPALPAEEVTRLLDSARAMQAGLSAGGIARLSKTGMYAMHHQKQPVIATEILEKAHSALQEAPDVLAKMKQNGEAYRLGNNLAYAMANQPEAGEEAFKKAETLLAVTAAESQDTKATSFAQRIHGHIAFARSKQPGQTFEEKKILLRQGVEHSLQGVEKLNLPEDLADTARTYNRVAAEYLELAKAGEVSGEVRAQLLHKAKAHSIHAQKLWQTHSAPEEFAAYKQTAGRVSGEISAALQTLGVATARKL